MKALTVGLRRPDITIYRNGRIEISARVVSQLDIHQEDVINVALDDDNEIYLYVSPRIFIYGRFKGRCVRTNRNGHHMRAYSRALTDELFRLMKAPQSTFKANIATGELVNIFGTDYLTLILKKHTL